MTADAMRGPQLQQKAVNYAFEKGRHLIDAAGKAAIGELSDFVATEGYKREDLRRAKKGGAVNIHKAIGKLPKPRGGWTLPSISIQTLIMI